MNCVPIALFAYNRPQHLRRTVEALRKNDLASKSRLYIFCDAARKPETLAEVEEVRAYARTVDGFAAVIVKTQEKNLGLAASITSGVTALTAEYGRVIVLEDDLVTSPDFLQFMNRGLELYADVPHVASISGYSYPVKGKLPDSFFIRGADCWGWATWERAWQRYNCDAEALLAALQDFDLADAFDYNGAASNIAMLEDQMASLNDSWAVRWHASTFIADMLTLYPGRSLVQNIGFDGTGVHCKTASTSYDVELARRAPKLRPIPVRQDEESRELIEAFFRTMGTRTPAATSPTWRAYLLSLRGWLLAARSRQINRGNARVA